LTPLDWAVVVAYFAASAALGLRYARRAGGSLEEYFLSGRELPWWLAGTSMVATTFAADTPLAVTELVARNGIAGNWLWWNFAFGGVLTVFFFARLWRRAGILTDVELVELRYSGRPAAFLRGFRAVWVGILMNCLIMGWVNLAMGSILEGLFGIPRARVLVYVGVALAITAAYSALSGLWGVAVTDAFQFALAMAGTIVLAVVVLARPEVGGVAGLVARLPAWAFRFAPELGGSSGAPTAGGAFALTISAFLAYVGVQWWASWYPGAEPGGGGFVAQRIMSSRDERHSVKATLWFAIAHYCVRPWPWILVGLATLVLYPDLPAADKRLGYVWAMRDFLPAGLKGMLVAAFLAAYMSTVATQLNWGASYVINDLYRRFLRPRAAERELVAVSRVTTLAIMVLSLGVTAALDTISGAWAFIIEASAGLGLVLILRWFWWRINAWSEIAAMVAPLVAYAGLRRFTTVQFPDSLYWIVSATTVAWLAATFLTPPVEEAKLRRFYERVRPGGPGWAAVARTMPGVEADQGLSALAVGWVAGVVLVYASLFATGSLIFGAHRNAVVFTSVAIAAGALVRRTLWRVPDARRSGESR
jgi:solute:Na+ symporter, SSS family